MPPRTFCTLFQNLPTKRETAIGEVHQVFLRHLLFHEFMSTGFYKLMEIYNLFRLFCMAWKYFGALRLAIGAVGQTDW